MTGVLARPHRTRVKICCIKSRDEAYLATRLGADALGLVGKMPSGPGVITDAIAAQIASIVPPPLSSFLLTAETTAVGWADQAKRIGPAALQVVSHVVPEEYAKLDKLLPRTRLKRVQVIHVEGGKALDLIDIYAKHVDAFLLDSGRPMAEIPELGGTGRVHDWKVSADFVSRSPIPVFLAGGLRPDNVAEAIARVGPYGLDLCTGVRSDDTLDARKLSSFMTEVAKADHARRSFRQ